MFIKCTDFLCTFKASCRMDEKGSCDSGVTLVNVA